MGIYCRKETGIFYAKKMINGILMRISLKTKNKMQAYSIYSEWENRLLIAKLNGDEKLPLPLSCQQKLEAKKDREINKLTLLQAFNEHLKVSENKHITESHMLSKKQIKKLIISQKIDWDDLTQENILKIQGKLRAEFSIHTVYKLIAHLKTFLNYAVKYLTILINASTSPQGHIFYGGTLPPKKGEWHYSDKFAKLRDELGLNPRLNLYKIRHTAISQVAKTHGIAVAQQMAGHKSIRTTLQNYCVPDTANVEKAQKDLLAKVMER